MKKTSFRLILAALAAAAALAACTKEVAPPDFENDKVEAATEGTRVITVSFGAKTRTTLDKNSLQPMFADGDSILLATVPDQNSPEAPQDTQTVAVTVDPTTQKATITTTLQGNLSAMYPARLAKLWKTGHYAIPVYEEQSGSFEDANVCRARINAGATTAEFENAYSLFIITPPDGTKKLTVRSLPAIGDDGQRTGETMMISNFNPDSKYTVTVSTPIISMSDTTYYVALLPGACIRDLSFEAWFDDDGTTGSIKGIPTSKIAVQAATTGIENYEIIRPGTAYTIDDTNWHEYVEFAGHKWATMNIGANAPEEYGDYFAWGDTVGHSLKSNWKDNYNSELGCYENVFKDDYAFTWSNCPFTNGVYSEDSKKVFTKYVPADKAADYGYDGYSDSKTVLDLCDDAAYVKWGGAWRMPTKKEFDDFLLQTDEYNDCVNNGCFYFNSLIKIPVSGGICEGTGLFDPTEAQEVYLWSSSLWASTPNTPVWATDLSLNADTPDFSVWCRERYAGAPIRAIVDDPDFIATED